MKKRIIIIICLLFVILLLIMSVSISNAQSSGCPDATDIEITPILKSSQSLNLGDTFKQDFTVKNNGPCESSVTLQLYSNLVDPLNHDFSYPRISEKKNFWETFNIKWIDLKTLKVGESEVATVEYTLPRHMYEKQEYILDIYTFNGAYSDTNQKNNKMKIPIKTNAKDSPKNSDMNILLGSPSPFFATSKPTINTIKPREVDKSILKGQLLETSIILENAGNLSAANDSHMVITMRDPKGNLTQFDTSKGSVTELLVDLSNFASTPMYNYYNPMKKKNETFVYLKYDHDFRIPQSGLPYSNYVLEFRVEDSNDIDLSNNVAKVNINCGNCVSQGGSSGGGSGFVSLPRTNYSVFPGGNPVVVVNGSTIPNNQSNNQSSPGGNSNSNDILELLTLYPSYDPVTQEWKVAVEGMNNHNDNLEMDFKITVEENSFANSQNYPITSFDDKGIITSPGAIGYVTPSFKATTNYGGIVQINIEGVPINPSSPDDPVNNVLVQWLNNPVNPATQVTFSNENGDFINDSISTGVGFWNITFDIDSPQDYHKGVCFKLFYFDSKGFDNGDEKVCLNNKANFKIDKGANNYFNLVPNAFSKDASVIIEVYDYSQPWSPVLIGKSKSIPLTQSVIVGGCTGPFCNLPVGLPGYIKIENSVWEDGDRIFTFRGTLFEALKKVDNEKPQGCWNNDVILHEIYWDDFTQLWYTEYQGQLYEWDGSSWKTTSYNLQLDSNTFMQLIVEVDNSQDSCFTDLYINSAQLPKVGTLIQGQNVVPVELDLINEVINNQITIGEAVGNLYGCFNPTVEVPGITLSGQLSMIDVTNVKYIDEHSLLTSLKVMCQ